jgi:hypothetical protein
MACQVKLTKAAIAPYGLQYLHAHIPSGPLRAAPVVRLITPVRADVRASVQIKGLVYVQQQALCYTMQSKETKDHAV